MGYIDEEGKGNADGNSNGEDKTKGVRVSDGEGDDKVVGDNDEEGRERLWMRVRKRGRVRL